MKTLVVLLGPTGVGKTALSVALAERLGSPILSADSRQLYAEIPIGTAAPTKEEQECVKHYFIGTHQLTDYYSAAQYEIDVLKLTEELFRTHDSLLLTGGSMMYIDAVCKGLDDIPDISAELREQVRNQYQKKGLEWLQTEVQRLDPMYWQEVDKQNPQRLMHCIEVTLASGQPYSNYRKGGRTAQERGFDVEYIMIERPREELYERINLRVHKMIEQGLLNEAQRAFDKLGLLNNNPLDESTIPNSVNTVGYKELLKYFRGEWTLERAIEMIQQNSRHYAKRQMTWWRRTMNNNTDNQ